MATETRHATLWRIFADPVEQLLVLPGADIQSLRQIIHTGTDVYVNRGQWNASFLGALQGINNFAQRVQQGEFGEQTPFFEQRLQTIGAWIQQARANAVPTPARRQFS